MAGGDFDFRGVSKSGLAAVAPNARVPIAGEFLRHRRSAQTGLCGAINEDCLHPAQLRNQPVSAFQDDGRLNACA
jgi:hypothetical protein